jgi:hypothetical protein
MSEELRLSRAELQAIWNAECQNIGEEAVAAFNTELESDPLEGIPGMDPISSQVHEISARLIVQAVNRLIARAYAVPDEPPVQ